MATGTAEAMQGDWGVGIIGCIKKILLARGPGTYRPIGRGQGEDDIFSLAFSNER
jgi:hypothetical protein